MSTRAQRVLVTLAAITLLILHSDDLLFDHATTPRPPVLGWIPADMAYHLAWTVAGMVMCWGALRCTWGRSR